MKTKPMKHQLVGRWRLAAMPDFFMLGCEQGTGKTWMLLDDAERQFSARRIDALLVVAPKGVHTNWILREIPAHMSIKAVCAYYLSGGGVRRAQEIERLFRRRDDRVLRVLAINTDALTTKDGFSLADRFLRAFRTMMIVDESQRIKNINSLRTRRALLLGQHAVSRRIASGTPITNSPLDIFAQMEFLSPRGNLLGTTSYRAFVAEYAELLPPQHRLVQQIRSANARGNPQIVARDAHGNPRWRNLEKLQRLLAPYMYRVLKSECLDLPEKIYQTRYFTLAPAQRVVYSRMKEQLQYARENGEVDAFTALASIAKLRQITSGFVLVDGVPQRLPPEQNPRMQLLREIIEDIDGQFIVWAMFNEELEQIMAMLAELQIPAARYCGKTTTKDRDLAVDGFQAGHFRAFVGQPHSGGVGLTLTAATTAIYYSIDFNLGTRLQSEDRCHRIGTTKHVVYIDLSAIGTIDERMAAALQAKEDVAFEILDAA